MMRVFNLMIAGTFLLGAPPLFAQGPGTQKLTGIISDALCGQTHSMKGMSAADCTRMCVKAGQKYALVVGSTVYTLESHEVDLDKYAGQKFFWPGRLQARASKCNLFSGQENRPRLAHRNELATKAVDGARYGSDDLAPSTSRISLRNK